VRRSLWLFVAIAIFTAPLRVDAGARVPKKLLKRLGPPRNPLYIRAGEVKSFKKGKLYKPRGLQVRRLGGKPIRVQRGKTYLWVIDAEGTVYLAPETWLPGKGDRVGHVNVHPGPAPIGGEFFYSDEDERWILNYDSGRNGHKHEDTRPRQLRAARDLFLAIGVLNDTHPLKKIKLEFTTLLRDRPRTKTEQIRLASYKRAGGYILTDSKKGNVLIPEHLRHWQAKKRWAQRVRPN
jgi:hypothetical protein